MHEPDAAHPANVRQCGIGAGVAFMAVSARVLEHQRALSVFARRSRSTAGLHGRREKNGSKCGGCFGKAVRL